MACRARAEFWATAGRLRRDDRGAVMMLVAVAATALLAITGLAVDVGWWYTIQRQNQSAADSAAIAGAYEALYNPTWKTGAQLTPAAITTAATQNRYTGGTPGAVVTYPYSDVLVAKTEQGVQVVLNQKQSSWFAALAGLSSVTIGDRAVAKVLDLAGFPCILALNKTAANAIFEAGNPTINAPLCTIVSDSNSISAIHLQGNSTMIAATVVTQGAIATTGNAYTLTLTTPAKISQPYVKDPYASTLTHGFLTNGVADPVRGAPPVMPRLPAQGGTALACTVPASHPAPATWPGNCVITDPTKIVSGDTLSANTQIVGGLPLDKKNLTISGGTVWITDGNLNVKNALLTCAACTIILTTAKTAGGGTVGAVIDDSKAALNLSAPSTGAFAGLAVIQDSNGLPAGTAITSPSTFWANSTGTVNGLVYFPTSHLQFQGGPSAAGKCLVIVADTIELHGNPGAATSAFDTSGCLGLGLSPPPKLKTVALVE